MNLKLNIKKRWTAILWFAIILLIFFFIDNLTKHFAFHPADAAKAKQNPPIIRYENTFFGFRSISHDNSTIFEKLGIHSLPLISRISIDVALAIAFMFPVFLTESKFKSISLGILIAGILGNTVDVIFTPDHSVRDFIFIPWWDKGTFNFADMFIVLGAGLFIISLIKDGFKKDTKPKTVRNEMIM